MKWRFHAGVCAWVLGLAMALPAVPVLAEDTGAAPVICVEGADVHAVVSPPAQVTVCFAAGRIVQVGGETPVDAEVIDGSGAILTPGFIDAYGQLGLVEVSAVPETRDADAGVEDEVRAAFRVAEGLNPFSSVIPITRSGGVTSAISAPSGGLISGQAALWDLGAASATDLVVRESAYFVVHHEGRAFRSDARSRRLAKLREVLEDARVLDAGRERFDENRMRALSAHHLDLTALGAALSGEVRVLFLAEQVADIRALLALSEQYGLPPAFLGASDAWQIADELAEAGAMVVINPMRNLPGRFDQLGARSDSAAILDDAGVAVVLADGSTHNGRNLRYLAGNAVRAGMNAESALRAITLHPAMLAGAGEELGAIEEGRVANLVLWSGDPFEFSSRPVSVWVRGELMDGESRQDRLLERYRGRTWD